MSRRPREQTRVFLNLVIEDGHLDEPRITTLVESILAHELADDTPRVITIHLVDDDRIRRMNAEHRGIDAVTDVLSFPLHEGDGFVLPPDHAVDLGDVVVSFPRAVDQAAEFGHSVERELAYLIAHGVLHLLGYDHEAEAERRVMRQKEEEALAPLGFVR